MATAMLQTTLLWMLGALSNLTDSPKRMMRVFCFRTCRTHFMSIQTVAINYISTASFLFIAVSFAAHSVFNVILQDGTFACNAIVSSHWHLCIGSETKCGQSVPEKSPFTVGPVISERQATSKNEYSRVKRYDLHFLFMDF